ncbi:MAG TPA: c-type cytochrome [Conexibacter sp.]
MRRATAWVLLLALALVAGCGDSSREDAAAAARARAKAARHARQMALGRRVFGEHCDTCHTIEGRRYTQRPFEWEAPNLDEVSLKRHYVEARVSGGGPAMASFASEMSPADFRALVDYVTETAGGNVVDDGGQPERPVAEGRQLFAQNCAACHAIEGRSATGRPTYPGIDFTLVKPSERYVIYMMKRGVLPGDPGGELMPRFTSRLTGAQMRAVAAYVNAVAKEGPEAPPPEVE